MGKVFSFIKNPLRNFNLESRAHKVLAKEKPTPAPKHISDQIDINRILKEYPKEFEDSLKKNETLDKYLKQVFVTSHDPDVVNDSAKVSNPTRPLPVNRHIVEYPEYGFLEPTKIPLGKVTLRKALKFITDHQMDANVNSSKKIAQEYSLPLETVDNILKYYKIFEVYIPTDRDVKAKFAGPRLPRRRIEVAPRKKISPGKSEENT